MRPPTTLLAVVQSTAVNHQARDEALNGARCMRQWGVAQSKKVWFHCGNLSLHGCSASVLLSKFTLSTALSLFYVFHIRFLSPPFFLWSLVLCLCFLGAPRKLSPTHAFNHSNNPRSPHYHANSHIGTRTVNYVKCCVRSPCRRPLSAPPHRARAPISLFSHTPVSVPSARKHCDLNPGPRGPVEWHICNPASQRNPA